MVFKFSEYLIFLKDRNVLSSALVILMGGMIKDVVNDFIKDIIIPVTDGELKIKKNILKIYSVKIINLIVITYLLFVLSKYLEDVNL